MIITVQGQVKELRASRGPAAQYKTPGSSELLVDSPAQHACLVFRARLPIPGAYWILLIQAKTDAAYEWQSPAALYGAPTVSRPRI